jgi:hypothetical protein
MDPMEEVARKLRSERDALISTVTRLRKERDECVSLTQRLRSERDAARDEIKSLKIKLHQGDKDLQFYRKSLKEYQEEYMKTYDELESKKSVTNRPSAAVRLDIGPPPTGGYHRPLRSLFPPHQYVPILQAPFHRGMIKPTIMTHRPMSHRFRSK